MLRENDQLANSNPWVEIPLADYEQHMSHSTVGQLSMLSSLTKQYLSVIQPATCLFIGIAGGNGLEHIDNAISKKVIGIDINQHYLAASSKRYQDKIDSLQLLLLDVAENTSHLCSADFIWAALVFEYIGVDKGLEFSKNNIAPGGHLIVTIQSSNNLQSVSATGIESVKKAGSIFTAIEPDTLVAKAKEMGFVQIGSEENQLPNGKAFLTFDFILE